MDNKRKNSVAQDLRTPKYKLRVVPNKKRKTRAQLKREHTEAKLTGE